MQSLENMERLTMNTKELATAMGLSYPKALELTERADFPCIRMGRRKVIPVEKFREWLNAQCPAAGTVTRGA